jgi:uncharacterized protein
MLLHSMIRGDEVLGLTDTSLENYLSITDEATLERLCALESGMAARLAKDYRDRHLLKCVYEKLLHKRDRHKHIDRKALSALEVEIAQTAGVERSHVFADASRASSMPLTPSKNEMFSILVTDKGGVREVPVSEIPLVGSIAGFFDMLRIYTTAESRQKVERSVKKTLGDQETLEMGVGRLNSGSNKK